MLSDLALLPLAIPRPWLTGLHLAATLFMTGVIVFVQVVHYPLMARVGREGFEAYEHAHMRLTSRVVVAPMVLELVTAVALVLRPDAEILAWVGLGLLGLIWSSTALLQAPLHARLVAGFDPDLHRALVNSNWIRTLAWGLRVPVAFLLLAG